MSSSSKVRTKADPTLRAQYLELLPIIISHVDLSSATPFPISLFTFLNDVFCQVYHQEDSTCAMLDNFKALTSMLQSHATPRIFEFVKNMRNGVSIWMKDMSTIIPDDDYNDTVRRATRSFMLATLISSTDDSVLSCMPGASQERPSICPNSSRYRALHILGL